MKRKADPLAEVDRHLTVWQAGVAAGESSAKRDKAHRVSVRGYIYEGEGSFVSPQDRPVRYLNAPLYVTDDFARRLLAGISPTGVDALWIRLTNGDAIRSLSNEYRLEGTR